MKKLAIILTALLYVVTAVAQTNQHEPRHAVVALSSVYMRIAPDYESALETQELMGTVVEITDESRYWREIISPQPYKAWCTEKGLIEMTKEELEAYNSAPKCIYTELYGHIYETPSCKSNTICDLVGGDIMRFVNTNSKSVRKGKWTQVMHPSGMKGWV